MQPIFNSLGSNYTPSFSLKSLSFAFQPWLWNQSSSTQTQLIRQLQSTFSSRPTFFYKGRNALTHILTQFGLNPGDQVLTQALTCQAVETGITMAGCQPVYVDIDPHTLNPSLKTLNQALKQSPQAKAVILQHTLGFPVDPQPIQAWCQKHHLFLIQDLAHAFGATTPNYTHLGASADAVMLSFGQDKILDGITGGAAIVNTSLTHPSKQTSNPPPTQTFKHLIYPALTQLIRSTYPIYLGKALHFLSKKLNFLTNPVTNRANHQVLALPNIFLRLLSDQHQHFPSSIRHRQKIAQTYRSHLNPQLQLQSLPNLNQSTCLRFPILVQRRLALIAHLKRHRIHLADIWYKAPVDTGSTPAKTQYQPGSCPQAEAIASRLLNLPTHHLITKSKARQIAKLINQHQLQHD